MDDNFEIPVVFNHKELRFPCRLLQYGFTVKLEVTIEEAKVLFERDEERNWRALLSYEDIRANKKLDPGLLKEIAQAIEAFTK